jgi:hypothetical protein
LSLEIARQIAAMLGSALSAMLPGAVEVPVMEGAAHEHYAAVCFLIRKSAWQLGRLQAFTRQR